ncbi:arginase [Haloterrigena turkmenica DSM 5511]|uniref:Arginase n=1 Tax=Haloterrigena turkmenica (strain ATCC 51198 / DSM 5511 / JCM 9101 / NCIMB 13204 / VKM B-1734 / 4k) TaxID=543526 RepID=D2RUH4_HALTV|nr:arginase [Haloterrigena turkmenica]ADB61146.1 arginase [Haloterrigena turkmenica DSM 5511]
MTTTVRIIGAPMDYGADRRGVDMGPSAIRYAEVADRLSDAGVTAVDDGDLLIPRAEERDPNTDGPIEGTAKFLREVEDVSTRLEERVANALADGEFPLVLGGDHSVAIGSMRGSAREADLGAIWFDAHADLNTPETSPSGNVHGMPLAATLGRGAFGDLSWARAPRVREGSIAYVGLRSIDEHERELVRDSEMTAYTMADIDERGMTAVVEDALDVATDGTDGVHVSLDLDWVDPKTAPGVGTPVRGGVTYREAHAALETVSERHAAEGILRSMDVVEVNPILDEGNETATIAAELTASAFGNRIL